MKEIHEQFSTKKGKRITLNAAVPARAVGLIAHIVEEIESGRKDCMAQKLYDFVEENTLYTNRIPDEVK
ncbi:hypothetical protein [Brevibacillus porteri]|nr:hypothetical protein [Brevibacillus porteri]MED2744505.1 hypothetical protein [Brevibacillus porteri]MED2895605.1 hypothetical protein [Brevibacillus porteri]MED4894170.1 hypothetical protein [Brevibacillus porteri]